MTDLTDRVLAVTTQPALLFACDVANDAAEEGGVLDLRALDTPVSTTTMRNQAVARWRAHKKLVVRIDEDPSAQVRALLLELSRREVHMTADDVVRFADDHRVVVRVAANTPPAQLVALFPVRVRASTNAIAKSTPAKSTTAKAAVKVAVKVASKNGGTHAGRR